MSATSLIHVAVGIVINERHEVLIAQRKANQYAPGLWEFPGGKVEPNEAVFSALQREFLEEIGIQIFAADPWLKFTHDYSDRQVLLDVWKIHSFDGTPYGAEGQAVQWVAIAELQGFEFPAGNQFILEKLSSFSLS